MYVHDFDQLHIKTVSSENKENLNSHLYHTENVQGDSYCSSADAGEVIKVSVWALNKEKDKRLCPQSRQNISQHKSGAAEIWDYTTSSAYIFCRTHNVFFKINQDWADHSFTSYWASQILFAVMIERLDLTCSFKSSILVFSSQF